MTRESGKRGPGVHGIDPGVVWLYEGTIGLDRSLVFSETLEPGEAAKGERVRWH